MFGSRFDHVAVVIKSCSDKADERHSVLIFESIGGEGVHLVSWEAFKQKNWQSLYEKIVFRKLNFERTARLLD